MTDLNDELLKAAQDVIDNAQITDQGWAVIVSRTRVERLRQSLACFTPPAPTLSAEQIIAEFDKQNNGCSLLQAVVNTVRALASSTQAALPTQEEINNSPHADLGNIPSDYSWFLVP